MLLISEKRYKVFSEQGKEKNNPSLVGRGENLKLRRRREKEKMERIINDHKPWGHKVYDFVL